jgi:hypothetical protein
MEIILNLCGPSSLWRGISILRREAVGILVEATHGKKIGTKNEGDTDEISIFRENSGSDDVGVRDADWL